MEWLKLITIIKLIISTIIGENIEIPRYEIDHISMVGEIFEISKHGIAEIDHISTISEESFKISKHGMAEN